MSDTPAYVDLKNVAGAVIRPITDLAAVNMTTVNGIVASGSTIGIRKGYIESCVVTELSQADQAATVSSSYIDGGTVYTLIGGYTVTSDVPVASDASPYRVPSEVAVREAIDAYVATGGSTITPGNGISVDGGALSVVAGDGINVSSDGVAVKVDPDGCIAIDDEGAVVVKQADVGEVLTGRFAESTTTYDDTDIVVPANLRGALSIGQAVDVSCAPFNTGGTITYGEDGFLGGFTCTLVSGNTVGFYGGTAAFPKYANELTYLMLADVAGTGTITPNGGGSIPLSSTPQRIAMTVEANNTGYFTASGSATVSVSNWRQYEVTALTPDAIAFLGSTVTNPDPDAFFRSTDVYSIRDKYLVKQDMVCPFIPTIEMSNSDLTVAAGLSYKMTYKSNTATTRTITADTIPTLAYGWDTHLQLFVDDNTTVNFQSPLVLEDPLTPNAGHNMTIKWRNGQALAYVDDRDIGYIVTVAAGTENGSLYYGLTSDAGEYITFANSLNGSTVTLPTTDGTRAVAVLGNGISETPITVAGGTLSLVAGTSFADVTLSGISFNRSYSGRGIDIRSCQLNSCSGIGSNSAPFCVYRYCENALFVDNTPGDFGIAVVIGQSSIRTPVTEYVRGCTFTAAENRSGRCVYSYGSGVDFDNCLFEKHASGIYFGGSAQYTATTSHLTNCIFNTTVRSIDCGNNGTAARVAYEVSGCTFGNAAAIRNGGNAEAVAKCTFTGGNVINCAVTGGTVNFSGTNILNSTVSGTGAVVFENNSTLSGSSNSHCLITGSTSGSTVTPVTLIGKKLNAAGTNAVGIDVHLKYVDIVGATYNASLPLGGFAQGVFEDCNFTNCNIKGGNNTLFTTGNAVSGSSLTLKNCALTSVSGNLYFSVYAHSSNCTVFINNCTASGGAYGIQAGNIVLSGTNTFAYVVNATSAATGVLRIVSGSTLHVSATHQTQINHIEIGTLSSEGVWTQESGTITITKTDGSDSHTVTGSTGTTFGWDNGVWTSDIV